MRLRPVAISVLSIALIFILPFAAFGQDSPNYFALKAGIFSPTGDLDDGGFDTGFDGEIAYGHYFNPNFALEVGLGYYLSDASVSGFDPVLLGSFREEDDITVIPITVTGKGIYPSGNFELFAEVGVGIYFADFEGVLTSSTLGTIRVDDDDFVFGGHLGVGASYNISKNVFLGVGAKYILTSEAEFQGAALGAPIKIEGDLNGFILTANLGFRF